MKRKYRSVRTLDNKSPSLDFFLWVMRVGDESYLRVGVFSWYKIT